MLEDNLQYAVEKLWSTSGMTTSKGTNGYYSLQTFYSPNHD